MENFLRLFRQSLPLLRFNSKKTLATAPVRRSPVGFFRGEGGETNMAKKQKTIKAISKRFKTTKSGKVLKLKDGQNHFNAKDKGKKTRQKRNIQNLSQDSAKNIKKLLKLK